MLIEIKNENKVGFEKEVWELLKNYDGEYAVQSFNPFSLKWFKDNASNVLRGQLSSYFNHDDLLWYKKFILKRMWLNRLVSKPDFISYNEHDCPNKYVNKYKGKKPILVWCIKDRNRQEEISHFADNIIFEGYKPK